MFQLKIWEELQFDLSLGTARHAAIRSLLARLSWHKDPSSVQLCCPELPADFRCAKCGNGLCSTANVLTQDTKVIVIEPLQWMVQSVACVDGKKARTGQLQAATGELKCPRCEVELGRWVWEGGALPGGYAGELWRIAQAGGDELNLLLPRFELELTAVTK